MAEGYETEDEQLESLKKWWSENGKSTVVSVVIALVAVFGWQGWQKQKVQTTEAASAIYQNLLQVSVGANGELSASQQATAKHLTKTLKTDFSGTTYALYAALYNAKFAVLENDLVTAESELMWVLDNKPSVELALQARLRLARVLSSQEKYEEALSQLNIDNQDPIAGFEELRGDIYLSQGDKEAAAKAYQKALDLSMANDGVAQNPILTMKLQQLTSHSDEAVIQQESKEGDA